MLEITHTGKWPEPIVITIAHGILSEHRNLLVGAKLVCEDKQVSAEMRALEKNGFVTITQLVPPAPATVSKEQEMTPEELAALEAELLSEDGRSAASKEED
jgi:hypothetical protein